MGLSMLDSIEMFSNLLNRIGLPDRGSFMRMDDNMPY